MRRILSLVMAMSCLVHGGTALKEWEYYRGDLGGTWEALRTGKEFKTNPAWEEVTVPHCFNATDAVDPYVAYYQGPGWYRTTLEVSNPYPDGRTLLHFGGAGQKTRVFVGDTLVGEHVGGYDEFSFDITDAVNNHLNEGKVTLLVRCDNSRDLEMMPSDLSDFNLYGGLYRPVHLEYRPFISAEWPVVDTVVDEAGREGKMTFQVKALSLPGNEGLLKFGLVVKDPEGREVADLQADLDLATQDDANLSYSLPDPQLWSPEQPNLYSWTLTSTGPDGESHAQSGRLGFRHFRFEKKGPFYLNGERLLLRGTHRHEDHAGTAAAIPDELLRREMEMMKSIGINFIRLGHYQQSRAVLELCDELGLLVWEEIPWCRGGLGGEAYRDQGRRMLRNMIAQHRHHPSVIIWGLGNENDWPGDFDTFDKEAIRGYMKELHDLAHELDPSRKTAIRRCAFCADIVDVYSPSIWAGWYRGKYIDYEEVSRMEMEQVDHFLHVEWGASHHARRHSEDPDKGLSAIRSGAADERAGDYLMTGGEPRVSKDSGWTETYACNLIDWHLKEQEKMDWLTGTAYWPFKDFSTPIRPDNPVPYVNQKGVVERDLTPKESFYVFQSYWTDEPMIRIYGHTWPVRWGAPEEPKMVKVYSNCESVELFLNGQSLGSRERDSQDFPAAGLRWVTPFLAGKNTVRAIGARDGKTVTDELTFEYQSEPWGEPAELKLELIEETPDTATVQVYALDENGVRCLDADEFVEFSLVGDGELIADLGTSIAARKVQLYNGRAQISLRKKGGKSVVCVESDGLPSVFLAIDEWIDLLQTEELSSFRQPTGEWALAGDVSLSPENEKRLVPEPGAGVVVNGSKGKTQHLITQMEHGDVEVHVEFMVPVGSNSGVYLQGRYEIQVLDSWGVEEPQHKDCGGIYQRWKDGKGYEGRPPRVNASRKPGEWQSFDIIFRAPRFDENGKKTANARFEKVVHNGVVIHENEEVTGPTRAAIFNDEQPRGPLVLQGDHGPVAYRNIRVRRLGE